MDPLTELATHDVLSDEEKKKQLIDTITAADQKAFQLWISQKGPSPRLDMPKDAMRHVLIPRRILELAEDPTQVDLVATLSRPAELIALVVEHRNRPMSNPAHLKQYFEDLKRYKKQQEDQEHARGIRIRLFSRNRPQRPSDVDSEHVRYGALLEKGILTVQDYVTNSFIFKISTNPEVLITNYDDREELRGKGVAPSFYQRVAEAGRDLGFRYLMGLNDASENGNIGFFVNKLGRSTIYDIQPQFRSLFGANQSEIEGTQRPGEKVRTIQFLYPEDKNKYLIQKST